jgi:hypothetical protein
VAGLTQAAGRLFPPQTTIVMVGDRKIIEPKLIELQIPIERADVDGNQVR